MRGADRSAFALAGAVFLAVVLGWGARASACLAARQDLRVLLGESDQGLVWADLQARRDADVASPHRPFMERWTVHGRIEVASSADGRATPVPGIAPFERRFQVRLGREGIGKAITDLLHPFVRRIRLAGFHPPRARRLFDCQGSRRCGDWSLTESDGRLEIAEGDRGRSTVVIGSDFAASADL